MAQVRSDIRTILDAVKTQLITDEVLGADVTEGRIRIVNREPFQVPITMGDQDILLRPRRELPAGQFDSGSGRIDRRAYRLLEVTIRSRLELDEADQVEIHLTDDDLGHFGWEDAVIDSLDLLYLTSSSNLVLFEPMRWVGGPSDPAPLRDHPGWIFSTIQFELGYKRNLTQ